jgi:hypothetical protein
MPSPHPVRAVNPGDPPGRDGLWCGAGVGGSALFGSASTISGRSRGFRKQSSWEGAECDSVEQAEGQHLEQTCTD